MLKYKYSQKAIAVKSCEEFNATGILITEPVELHNIMT